MSRIMIGITMVCSFLGIFLLAGFDTPLEMGTQASAKKRKARKVTFRKVWWIFGAYKCTTCHRPEVQGKKTLPPPAGLDLSTPKLAYKNLVGVQSTQAREGIYRVNNVEDFDPASRVAYSYLIYKLLGTQTQHDTIGGSGSQMPPRQLKHKNKNLRLHLVPQHHIRKLIRWIAEGATY